MSADHRAAQINALREMPRAAARQAPPATPAQITAATAAFAPQLATQDQQATGRPAA